MKNKKITLLITVLFLVALMTTLVSACGKQENELVIYTSVDQNYSEKLLKEYEKETGVKVRAVYDIEANKTVGLANKLIEEKDNPLADVFWNGEILQTIRLKEEGVLASSSPANASGLPDAFKDKSGEWYGFGGRARVLVYNKQTIDLADVPKTLDEFLTSDKLADSAIALPIFGTTSTHAAVLYAEWGTDDAKDYYTKLQEGGVQILDGNGVVIDYVSQKKILYGLTDTDDALEEIADNPDIGMVFLDQGSGEIGTLVIPNTVAKIKGGPNSDQADKFINWLLSKEVEQKLVDDEWIQIPVHDGVKANELVEQAKVKIMAADFIKAYEFYDVSKDDLTAIFVK